MTIPTPPPGVRSTSDLPGPATALAWRTVAVFFLIYTVSFLDRQILIFMVKPIRESLSITDFQFSLIQGLAFAVLYSTLGIPIGWLVDHRPRRAIVAAGIAVWSVGTISCGLAQRFWHMLAGRIGLGAGEATLSPTSYSMISDLFPPHKLTFALSIVGIGAQIGTVLAAAIAGYIAVHTPADGVTFGPFRHLQGWQLAMLLVGLVSLLLAPLVYTVPEPQRRGHVHLKAAGSRSEVLALLRSYPRFYLGHFVGFGFASMAGWAVTVWSPTFFIRQHGWDIQHAALATGSLALFAGLPGTLLMGHIVDRWFAAGRRDAHLVFYSGAMIAMGILITSAVLVESANLALLLIAMFNLTVNFIGVGASALQIVTPDRLRGRISAMYLLVYNLLGLGLGPILVAFMTDYVFRDDARIGYAILASVATCTLLSAACLLSAAPGMRAMVNRVGDVRQA